jgi:hypothetical protein
VMWSGALKPAFQALKVSQNSNRNLKLKNLPCTKL